MIDLGTVRPGTTLYIPFMTYDSNDPTASVTMTGLATTDIEIYKDGSMTQRGSDNGYTLLDTDGIDIDSITGFHGFSVDLADNSTAGFYAAGSQYWVVVSSITVDSGTVSFIAATFRIGMPDAVLNTTIATLASQTSFTLTAGPAEDDALNGCVVYIHDVASAVQGGFAVVSAYTGSSKTVTLTAGTTFTAAATDNIAFYPPANLKWFGATVVTGRDIGTSVLLSSGTGTGQISLSSGAVTAGTVSDKTGYGLADDAITSAKFDESTAFPLKSADTGSTAVARVGADSDTLETLSDQIDLVATAAQVSAIGSGTGAALNFEAVEDNASGAIIGGTTKVGTQTLTFASTTADNAVYHDIAHAGNAIDWVYGFSVGGGRNASKVTFNGQYIVAAPIAGKVISVYAWNFTGTPAWQLMKTIAGQASGGTDVTVDIALLSAHTGTGASAGKVYIRFAAAADAVQLRVDQLLLQAQNLGQTVGYANGSLWVKTSGTSGTTPYVNGTADNPAPWADIKTLNTTLGLNRYVVTPGTTVTLDAALAGAVMSGRSYALALGGQNISGSYFEGVEGLSGIGTCATAEAIIMDSHLNAVTIGEADFIRCHLMDTVTLSQASVPYRFHDCTGITSAKITFNAANQSAVVSRLSGVLTIAGMVSTNTLYIDGDADVTIDATNDSGIVYIAGCIRLTDNGTTMDITDSARYDQDGIAAAVRDVDNSLPAAGSLGIAINSALTAADLGRIRTYENFYSQFISTFGLINVTATLVSGTLQTGQGLSVYTQKVDGSTATLRGTFDDTMTFTPDVSNWSGHPTEILTDESVLVLEHYANSQQMEELRIVLTLSREGANVFQTKLNITIPATNSSGDERRWWVKPDGNLLIRQNNLSAGLMWADEAADTGISDAIVYAE